tara:strand:- start:1332 stop:1799 length:468 start_codon:yes stop_codon:yes gene_type:complete
MLFILNILYTILFYFEPVVVLLWLSLVLFTCHWYKYTNDKNENKFYGLSEIKQISMLKNNCTVVDPNDLATVMRYNAVIGGVLYLISLFFRIHPMLVSIGLYIKIVGIILIIGTMICIPIYTSFKDINNTVTLGYSYYLAIIPTLFLIIKCIYLI